MVVIFEYLVVVYTVISAICGFISPTKTPSSQLDALLSSWNIRLHTLSLPLFCAITIRHASFRTNSAFDMYSFWVIVAGSYLLYFALCILTVKRQDERKIDCLLGIPFCGTSSHGASVSNFAMLLVIAHPDDESMFFSPLLAHYSSNQTSHALLASDSSTPTRSTCNADHPELHILCLSTGDADGLGNRRSLELLAAARVAGIPSERVTICCHPLLRDGLHEQWSPLTVAALVAGKVAELSLVHTDVVLVTFDARGISGHPNHVDTHRGVMRFLDSTRAQMREAAVITGLPARLHCWLLPTFPLWRKYASWAAASADMAMQLVSSSTVHVCVCSMRGCAVAWECMKAHASQWVWYRRLFLPFAAYTYATPLRVATTEDVQRAMQ